MFNLNRDATQNNVMVGASANLTFGTAFTLATAGFAALTDLTLIIQYEPA